MSINTDRDQRRAAGELTRAQERVLCRLLAGWRVRDWQGGIKVRAVHPTEPTQREEYGRASLVPLKRRGLVTAHLHEHKQEWFLTDAGRALAGALAATGG